MNGNNFKPMTERQGKRLLSITSEMSEWAKTANIRRHHQFYGYGDLCRFDNPKDSNDNCIYCIIEYDLATGYRFLGFNKTLRGAYFDMRELLLLRYKLWFNSSYRRKFTKPTHNYGVLYIHKQRLGD